ncbi:hypothetical protein [Micromonospora sp. LOL_023]|uniref:hypothetical protein n=1 Tax=Micromonospora sp. LOL_023 TaxID=3345418 RepID=UPI003A891986
MPDQPSSPPTGHPRHGRTGATSPIPDQRVGERSGSLPLAPERPTSTSQPGAVARHHGSRRRSPLLLSGAFLLVAAALAGLRFVPGAPLAPETDQQAAGRQVIAPAPQLVGPARPGTGPTADPTPTLPPLAVAPTEVELDMDGWWSWAMLDQRTGKITGSDNLDETSTTASLIKTWIAADYLRRADEAGRTPNEYRMQQLEIMIRDSDNWAAEDLWQEIGRSAAIERMIDICELTDSSSVENRWSLTRLSPRDITRLGACVADGRAAGDRWTDWLLEQMRSVRSPGDFGVVQAFPDDETAGIAIKNGWVIRDDEQQWHVNCLAIGDGWTLGVMARFPTSHPYSYGADMCRGVAQQLRDAAARA